LEISKVFASPLIRTQQTAQLVFPDLEIEQADDLIECEYGDWTGKKLSELAKDPLWPLVQNSPDKVTFPNGESMQNMSDRATAQIQNIDLGLTEQYGENFIWAAVSHGDVIKAVIASALELELSKFQKIYVEPASVSVIRYNKGDSSVVKVNDTGDGWVEQLAKLAEPALGGQTGATED
jgi:probable phosphomutase (TIGR03848 family)